MSETAEQRRKIACQAFHQLSKNDQKKLLSKIKRACIPGDEECWWTFYGPGRPHFYDATPLQLEGAMITAGFEPENPEENRWFFRMHRRSPLNTLIRHSSPFLFPPMQPKDEDKEGTFYWWMMKYYYGTYSGPGELAEYMYNDLFWPRVNARNKLKKYLVEECSSFYAWYLDAVWIDYQAWKKGMLPKTWFEENQKLHEEKFETPYLGKLYFKGFDNNLRGDNDYQYEVGREYTEAGPYYFAAKVSVCAGYYAVYEGRFCIVEPIGPIEEKRGNPITERGFYTAPGIRIIREISRDDVVRMMIQERYDGSSFLNQIFKVRKETPFLWATWKDLIRRGFFR